MALDTAATDLDGTRFMPSVQPPRKSFVDKLNAADRKLLDKHLLEPAE